MSFSVSKKSGNRKNKVLVAGYIGGINVGDEAIALTVAASLKEDHNCDVTIASGQPELSQKYMQYDVSFVETFYPGKLLDSKALFELIKVIKNTDILLFAGGGLLQDVHSTKLLEHGAFLCSIAKVLNKKVVAIGVGAGPIKSELGKQFANTFMRFNDVVYFRDEYSRNYIENTLHIESGTSRIALDSILLIKINKILKAKSKNKIGLCIRDWPGLPFNNISLLLKKLIDLEYKIVFIPYEKSDILLFGKLHEMFGNNIVLAKDESFESTLETIGSLHFLISMRLHANLFSALLKTPFVALAYDNKLRTVFSSIGYENNVFDLDFPFNDVFEKVINSSNTSMSNLDDLTEIQHKALDAVLNDSTVEIKKMDLHLKVTAFLFWMNRLVFKPTLVSISMKVSPFLKPIVPSIIEKKIKKMLGIDW